VNAAILPAARDDIIRQYRWYLVERDAPDAALRFLDAVEESIGQLSRMPEMGPPREIRNPVLKGLRVCPVNGFEEILIFYLVRGGALRIIRVLHGKRDVDRILKSESS
jgi:toxin ParE1/3/4